MQGGASLVFTLLLLKQGRQYFSRVHDLADFLTPVERLVLHNTIYYNYNLHPIIFQGSVHEGRYGIRWHFSRNRIGISRTGQLSVYYARKSKLHKKRLLGHKSSSLGKAQEAPFSQIGLNCKSLLVVKDLFGNQVEGYFRPRLIGTTEFGQKYEGKCLKRR